jgi:hypothetical protein
MRRRHLLTLLCSSTAVYGAAPTKQKPVIRVAKVVRPKLELYLMLPEPRIMRSAYSIPLGDSRKTVFTPAQQIAAEPGLAVYSKEQFSVLGISPQSFADKAKVSAETQLAKLVPEFIKDEAGQTRYAVYRGESPLISSLILAPSLGKMAVSLFGGEMWAAIPDRNSLYLFPARQEAVEEFTEDLAARYTENAFSCSPELFLIKPGAGFSVVGQFAE